MLEDRSCTDVKFIINGGSPVDAHKVVLIAASPIFRQIFLEESSSEFYKAVFEDVTWVCDAGDECPNLVHFEQACWKGKTVTVTSREKLVMAVGRVFWRSAVVVVLLLFDCYKTENEGLQRRARGSKQNPYIIGSLTPQIEQAASKKQANLTGRHLDFTPRGKRYLSSRVQYYGNTVASFQLARLLVSGDICPNPGPVTTTKCSICSRTVARNHRAISCETGCEQRCHIKCANITPSQYKRMQLAKTQSWTCSNCLWKELPFVPNNNLESEEEEEEDESSTERDEDIQDHDRMCITGFTKLAQEHTKNCKIGHINVNSLAGHKFHEVKSWLLNGLFDVLVITETKLDPTFPNNQFNVDGFRLCRADRNIHGGGLMMYIRSDIAFKRITNPSQPAHGTEYIACKMKIGKSWSTVVGVYRPPSLKRSQWQVELSNLFEMATSTNDTFILGDFNCDMLEPDKPPKDGRCCIDLLDIFHLKNVITVSTRVTATSESLIDLVLTNNKRRVLRSGVVDAQISDHSVIYTILRTSLPRSRSRKVCFRSLKNLDAEKLIDDLNKVPFHIMEIFDDTDDKLYIFESLYNNVLDEHAPIKSVHIRGNQVPFMNDQWRKAIRHRNRLWRHFVENRTDANYATYKAQRNKCTSLRRKAIKAYFQSKAEHSENPRDFWNAYRPFLHSRKSNQANDIILKEKENIITDKKQVAEIFNEFFVNIANQAGEVAETAYGKDFGEHPSIKAILTRNRIAKDTFTFTLTNRTEIDQTLSNINIRKSGGHDLLPPKLIKASASAIAAPLSHIMNSSIKASAYPMRWKKGQVTPLFKKDDELYKGNYRPISVLPVLNNIYEKILASQLYAYFENILSDFICAYRRNYSCESALLRLVEDWKTSLDNKEVAAVISLDLSKAFDCIPHGLLLAKLKAYGVAETSVSLLRNYLTGRLQRVKIGDSFSTWLQTTKGVPQGSVLGPLLFNIFLNDLFYFIDKVRMNAYADDEQMYDSDKDPAKLEARLQCELLKGDSWFNVNGMIANSDKYQAMIIGKTKYMFNFRVKDFKIPVKESIDLLGMNIDNTLQFHNHITDVCGKVNNQANVLIRFRKLIPSAIKYKLYKAFIAPYFYYCSSVWHFCGARNSEKLEQLNKRVLRIVFNDRSLSYDNLLYRAGCKSLYNRRLQDMLILAFKALNNPSGPTYMSEMFTRRPEGISLRGSNKLTLLRANTTNFGLHSFRYLATKSWNNLDDEIRTAPDLKTFKRLIRNYTFNNNCCKFCANT